MKVSKLSELPNQPVSHDAHLFKKVMISYGEVPHLTNFSQIVMKPGESTTQHQHEDMYEIFFINQGMSQVTINNEQVTIMRDMSITIEPKVEHSFQNTGTEDLVMTYFGVVKE